MRIKKIGVFACFLLLMIIFLANVSGEQYDCDFRLASQCSTTPWNNTVMRISGLSNAHGEVWNGEGNYPYVICCNWTASSRTCESDGSNVLVRLSSPTNAHAETKDWDVYPISICYEGLLCEDMSGCNSDYYLELLSLSGLTNAHIGEYDPLTSAVDICCKNENEIPTGMNCAESGGFLCSPPSVCTSNSIYITGLLPGEVCCSQECCTPLDFSDVCTDLGRICGNFSNSCGGIINCGSCNTGEECVEQAGQCFDSSSCSVGYVSWDRSYASEGQSVSLYVAGTNICWGSSVLFNVWEDDGLLGTDSVIVTPNDAQFNSEGLATGSWIAEWQQDGFSLPEYQFKASNSTPGIDFSLDSGTGAGAVKELTVNLTSVNCTRVLTCKDYTQYGEEVCEANSCEGIRNIIDGSAASMNKDGQLCGYDKCPSSSFSGWYDNCECYWDDANDVCGFTSEMKICYGGDENLSIGVCNEGDGGTTKECDEEPDLGWYIYSWEGLVDWSTSGFVNETDCIAAMGSGCVEDRARWYYDPLGLLSSCSSGTNTIECPALMKLPFFGVYNFIIALIAISLVYAFLIKKRNK